MIKLCLANHFSAEYRYQVDLLKSLDSLTESAIVIVPEQSTLQTESELIGLLNSKGLLNIEVLSFKRIVRTILRDTIYDGKPPISDLGKQMLLAEIIEDGKDELELYAAAYKIKGFLEQLSDLIGDFRHQGIVAGDLAKLGEQSADSVLFSKKIAEISYIYDAYLARLDAVAFDEDGLIEQAIAQLAKRPIFADKTVVVSGFSSMTGSEQNLLVALANQARRVNVHVVVDSAGLVDDYARTFVRSLTDKLATKAYQVERDFTAESAAVKSYKAIFGAAPAARQGISCMAAANSRAELDALFVDVVNNYQTGRYRWRDMAVVSNQLAQYYRQIERLAARYKVPIFIDGRRPAIGHYIVDFILTLLRTLLYFFRLREVIKVMKTGFFNIDERLVWQLENWALAHDVNGADWFGDWRDQAELETTVKPILSQLRDLKGDLEQALSAEQKVVILRQYLTDLGVFERVAADVEQRYAAGDYQRSEELAQVYNIIDDVFYQVYAIGRQRSLSLEQFYTLLKIGFENFEIGIIPQGQDYLVVGNIKRTRLAQLKTLYFIGMDEEAIPSAALRASLFNDAEMMHLRSIGLEGLPTQMYSYQEEVFKTYEKILKADAVKWYYAKSTLEGDLRRPSLWFKQLGDAQSVTVSNRQIAELGLVEVYAANLLNQLATDLNISVNYDAWQDQLDDGAAQRQVEAFRAGRSYRNCAPKLNENLIAQLYGRQLNASISRLESYAGCPYQHFISYGLRPKVDKQVDLDFLDIGDFYHKIIENVMNDWLASGLMVYDEAQLTAFYQKHYDAYLEQHYRFRYNAKNRYFARRLKSVLATSLKQAVRQLLAGNFSAIHNEVQFSNRSDAALPALKLYERDGRTVHLHGVIDRLDLATTAATDYLRIVDYKSSPKRLDVTEVLHGLQLQLMIYLNAACRLNDGAANKPLQPFGAFYFAVDEVVIDDDAGAVGDIDEQLLAAHQLDGVFIDSDEALNAVDRDFAELGSSQVIKARAGKTGVKVNHQVVTADELNVLKDYALLKATKLADQIYRGDIAIAPVLRGAKTPCQYCHYGDICRFDVSKGSEDYHRLMGDQDRADVLAQMKGALADEFN